MKTFVTEFCSSHFAQEGNFSRRQGCDKKSDMCQNCVNNVFPDRGHTCLENGSYLMNFASCAQCNKKEMIKIHNKEEREEEEEQVITYQHVCQNCDHVIAEHEYRFCVEDGYQEYQMTCLLCGSGEDSISILPDDPRKEMDLF